MKTLKLVFDALLWPALVYNMELQNEVIFVQKQPCEAPKSWCERCEMKD